MSLKTMSKKQLLELLAPIPDTALITFALECPSPQSGAGEAQKRVVGVFLRSEERSKMGAPLEVSREGQARVGVIPKPVLECGLRSSS